MFWNNTMFTQYTPNCKWLFMCKFKTRMTKYHFFLYTIFQNCYHRIGFSYLFSRINGMHMIHAYLVNDNYILTSYLLICNKDEQ